MSGAERAPDGPLSQPPRASRILLFWRRIDWPALYYRASELLFERIIRRCVADSVRLEIEKQLIPLRSRLIESIERAAQLQRLLGACEQANRRNFAALLASQGNALATLREFEIRSARLKAEIDKFS